jgi:hypothetical protein
LNTLRSSKSYEDALASIENKRKQSKIKGEKVIYENWKTVDTAKYVYEEPKRPIESQLTLLKRDPRATLLSIFLKFVTIKLLKRIWDDGNTVGVNSWVYRKSSTQKKNGVSYTLGPSTINSGEFSAKLLYKWLAILIRVIGAQNKPKENTINDRPLRENLKAEANFFDELAVTRGQSKDAFAPNYTYLEILTARFLMMISIINSTAMT